MRMDCAHCSIYSWGTNMQAFKTKQFNGGGGWLCNITSVLASSCKELCMSSELQTSVAVRDYSA